MKQNTLDLANLRSILGNSAIALYEALNVLHEELPLQTENLKKSAKTGNWKQLSQDAHKMRSCIMMIGMPNFLSLVESLEKKAEEEVGLSELTELAEDVVIMSYTTIQNIKTELEKIASNNNPLAN